VIKLVANLIDQWQVSVICYNTTVDTKGNFSHASKPEEVAVRRNGYILLTFEFHKEGRRWTALCKELGTATFGRSVTEAETRLQEAVVLHLSTLDDVGESERFFKEHNIQFHSTKPKHDLPIRMPATTGTFARPHIQRVREPAFV